MIAIGDDWPYYGDVRFFILNFSACNVACVSTDDKLLCARDVVVENVLTYAFVEIVLARRSKVLLNRGTDDSRNIGFCNEQELDVSC